MMDTFESATHKELRNLIGRHWATTLHSSRDYVERLSAKLALEVINVEDIISNAAFSGNDSDLGSEVQPCLARIKTLLSENRDMPPLVQSDRADEAERAVYDRVREVAQRLSELEEFAKTRGTVHPLHIPEIRAAVWNLTDGKCAYCDVTLDPIGKEQSSFCIEHVVPRSAGGPDNLANYVPSCHSCNSSKNGSHVLEFINRRFPNRRPPVVLAPTTPPAPRSADAALAQFVEVAA